VILHDDAKHERAVRQGGGVPRRVRTPRVVKPGLGLGDAAEEVLAVPRGGGYDAIDAEDADVFGARGEVALELVVGEAAGGGFDAVDAVGVGRDAAAESEK
jgi:hypothetical protein